MNTALDAAKLRDSSHFRQRVALVVVLLGSATVGWCLTAVGFARVWEDPTAPLIALLALGIAVSALLTVVPLYSLWSWSVRAQIECLENAEAGASAWKAWGYPINVRSLERFSEDRRFFFVQSVPRANLYALFSEDALTLWARRADRLHVVVRIPRAAARYRGRDWRRPIFTFVLESETGEGFPFSLALTREDSSAALPTRIQRNPQLRPGAVLRARSSARSIETLVRDSVG